MKLMFTAGTAAAALMCSVAANATDFVNTYAICTTPHFTVSTGNPLDPTSTVTAAFMDGFTAASPTSVATFDDTFTFRTLVDGVGSGSISTSFSSGSTMLTLTDLIINGTHYAPSSGTAGQFTAVNNIVISGVPAINTIEVLGYVTGSGTFSGTTTFTPGAVPEPATWAMFIGGFGMLGAAMRRRKVAVSFS